MPLIRAALVAALTFSPLPGMAAQVCAKPSPVGGGECPGVRPGAVLMAGDQRCTFGFLFQGSDKRRYAATAGHCAYETDPPTDPGTTSVWKNNGLAVTDAAGKQVGRFAYATMVGSFVDFALVRLNNGVPTSPQMCHFGGPVGLTTAISPDDVQVRHYGQGTAMGSTPARTGDAFFGLYRKDYVFFYGAATPGDSGSPVTTADGEAIGVLTDLTTPFTGNVGVVRLPDMVAAAQKALRIKLTLLTAPEL